MQKLDDQLRELDTCRGKVRQVESSADSQRERDATRIVQLQEQLNHATRELQVVNAQCTQHTQVVQSECDTRLREITETYEKRLEDASQRENAAISKAQRLERRVKSLEVEVDLFCGIAFPCCLSHMFFLFIKASVQSLEDEQGRRQSAVEDERLQHRQLLDNLRRQLDESSSRVSALEGELREAENHLEDASSLRRELDERKQSDERNIREMHQAQTQLFGTLEAIAKHEVRVAELEREVGELSSALALEREGIAVLRRKNDMLRQRYLEVGFGITVFFFYSCV